MPDPAAPILTLRNVSTHFPLVRGFVFRRQVGLLRAVDGVDIDLRAGEVLGLVGESGCGKSTLARTILQLVAPTAGTVVFEGKNLAELNRAEMRLARRRLQMVFQDPYASLNPRMTVFDTLAEPLLVHRVVPKSELPARVAALMERVGLAPRFAHKYPHEFSGGQRQRIAIARALALEPRVIVADEPVSALDVSIQAQIINLLAQLVRDLGLGLVFISHDLGVVKHLADRVAVMYLGKIVEEGPAAAVLETPAHPYTRSLVDSIPTPDKPGRRARQAPPGGDPPSPLAPPVGCGYHPRCPRATALCRTQPPMLAARTSSHKAACIHPLDETEG